MTYLAAIRPASRPARPARPASRRTFSLWLPDFPGVEERCTSIRDAERRAHRAVHEALGRLMRGGVKAPQPTRKEELEDEPAYRSAFLLRVRVNEDRLD